MAWPIPAPRVFHPGALPIRNSEFADAVRATCKPRFPASRCTARRNVGKSSYPPNKQLVHVWTSGCVCFAHGY